MNACAIIFVPFLGLNIPQVCFRWHSHDVTKLPASFNLFWCFLDLNSTQFCSTKPFLKCTKKQSVRIITSMTSEGRLPGVRSCLFHFLALQLCPSVFPSRTRGSELRLGSNPWPGNSPCHRVAKKGKNQRHRIWGLCLLAIQNEGMYWWTVGVAQVLGLYLIQLGLGEIYLVGTSGKKKRCDLKADDYWD